jgi:hypothetical protein
MNRTTEERRALSRPVGRPESARRQGPAPWAAVASLLLLSTPFSPIAGAEQAGTATPQTVSHLSGAPESSRAAWERPHTIVFSGKTSLRQAVEKLAEESGMTIVLDRRVDPQRPITLNANEVPLGKIWSDLAEPCGLGVSWVGPVVYLGPPDTAAKLRTLTALRRAEAALLPPDLRSALSAKKPSEWSDLEEPQSLWTRWMAEAGLRQSGGGVPHDLWPAARWPALSLVDRLTLVAAEFDRTFAVDPVLRTVALTPIPETVEIERSYPAPVNAAETVRRWQGLAPQAVVRQAGDRLIVVGREEDHEAIASGRARPVAVAPEAKPAPAVKPAAVNPAAAAGRKPPGTKVFKLRAKDVPLKTLIEHLRKQGNDVRMDEAALKKAGIDLGKLTSVDVVDATLVEVLEAAGKPLGLTARQAGGAVELVPLP